MIIHLKAILNSYSEIFFLKGYRIGLIFLVATLINPNVALAGIIAVAAAYGFANFIGMDREFLKSGFYTYNPLLVGLSIGYLFRLTPETIFFVIAAGIFTFVLTTMLANIFWHYLRLPILSLPFVIVSSIAYLAASQYANLFVSGLYPHGFTDVELYLPYWVSGFLKSLGSILFMPDVLTGFIFLLAILFSSRILVLLMLGGYYTGALLNAWLIGSFQQSFADLNGFNFILIAIALGGVFFIPSPKTYLIALIGVGSATFMMKSVEVFWSNYGIPAFTLPFNLVSLTFIYALGIANYPLLAHYIRATPEATLDEYLTNARRFPGSLRTIALPFSGQWTVWQAFDGQWTHQGSWRYAYDFVISDADGSTYKGEGALLEDYYAYRKPVLSPVRGRVVKVMGTLPDMPVGQVDKANNWGNWVVIYDSRGYYVEISHFARESIAVKAGEWVEVGAYLGLCGNSGYSPQPHIHVQLQATEEIGSYTLPFSFTSYVEGDRFFSNHLPAVGDIVSPGFSERSLDLKLTFILDQVLAYAVWEDGRRIDELHLKVKMAPDGTFYFDSGKGRLYFGKHEGTFYFYRVEGNDRYLDAFLLALPRLPLTYRESLAWEDDIPVSVMHSRLRKSLALFLSSFRHRLYQIQFRGQFEDQRVITGTVASRFFRLRGKTRVVLDDINGIHTIRYNNIELRKINDEAPMEMSTKA